MDSSIFCRGSILVVKTADTVYGFSDLKDVDTLAPLSIGAYPIVGLISERPSSVDVEIILNGSRRHVIVSQLALDAGHAEVSKIDVLPLEESRDLVQRLIALVLETAQ